MIESLKDIESLLKKHVEYRENSLNLIASENYSSPTIRNYLATELGNRYGCYSTLEPENREYRGNKFIHELEMESQALVSEIFAAHYVDLRPLGGHMAGMATVLGILSPGDLVIEISLKDWGHGLVGPMCQVPHFNETIRVDWMPFTKDRTVDVKKLIKMIYEKKPKLIIFGGSGMLFPEPIEKIKEVAGKEGVILAHDASHVTGLIAAGVFPNPLDQGVDIMFGSTHKSFPGPQGGFIVSRNLEKFKNVSNALAPSLVTSHHLNRLPALAAAILEMKKYGNQYGRKVIKNSKALGKALDECGFKVIGAQKGYSDTHLILLDVSEFGKSAEIAKVLESAGIFCSDDFGAINKELRIGSAEATRRGMQEKEMEIIAQFFKRVIIQKEDPSKIIKEVGQFVGEFSKLEYSFDKVVSTI